MISMGEITALAAIAISGHVMAFTWYAAARYKWRICERTIYDLPINDKQVSREFKNSLHTPMHAIILAGFLYFRFFQNDSWLSFVLSAIGTTVWAETWHYASHRAFHVRALHWIHVEHHKSALNSPFTAVSFSFTEKLIFDLGLLLPLAAIDCFVSLNFYGIAAWYVGYLIINSFSHANYELKPERFNRSLGKVLTSATYHSLHHSRYTGNYGLGTRVLDQLFGTEWDDYEPLYDRVSCERRPLTKLREKAVPPKTHSAAG
jgi:Delta7-sterol 5-desaturase